jgi:hypothetical protein
VLSGGAVSSANMSVFDYDSEGRAIVLADGAELLVHDGESEAPLFRRQLGAGIAGVASMRAGVMALDARGGLHTFSIRGEAMGALELGVTARSLARDASGTACVVLHDGGAIAIDGARELARVAVPAASTAAIAPDRSFAVGTRGGELCVFDASGQLRERHALGTPVYDVDHHPSGAWMAACGAKIFRVEGGQVAVLTNAPEGLACDAVRCSADGSRIGLALGDRMALAMAYPSRDTIGSVTYGDRAVTGMAFGPGEWLGVGLDGGDGNKVDFASGEIHRTDTHPGRQHRSWVVMLDSAKRAAPPRTQTDPVAAQLAALGFFDVAAKRQARFLRIFGVVMIAIAVAFPFGTIFGGIPIWVTAIAVTCSGFLGVMCAWLGRNSASRALRHLREHRDPIASAKVWAEVRNGMRTVNFELATAGGQRFVEGVDVSRATSIAYDEEAQAIAAVKKVVPRVDILVWTGNEWVVDEGVRAT